MARIELRIDADNADDLQETLMKLSGQATVRHMIDAMASKIEAPVGYSEEVEQPHASATQDAEPGERTRFKRTRDEIARGLTVEQAKAERARAAAPDSPTSASATDAQPDSQESAASTLPTSSQPPAAGSGEAEEDPFASPPTSSDLPASETPEEVTYAMVKEQMRVFLSEHDAAACKGVLNRFKGTSGQPAERLADLDPATYADVYAAFKA